MIIDAISNGIVIDHITAGKAMYLYKVLELDKLDCSVALLKNVVSNKLGRKDIIKIDDNINVDLDVLGYIDPVSALLFSALFLGERLSPLQLAGAVLILGGAAFGELYKGRQKQMEE